jgi:hypothetical protein
MELQKRCGFYVIHTDTFYHPLGGNGLKCQVGEEAEEKNKMIREYRNLITKTTVIEGSHIGNKQELEIFARELEFEGNLYAFKVESPRIQEQFKSKHKEEAERNWEVLNKWFGKIYNLKEAIVVENAEEVINFLEIHNGNICIPRQG